MSGRLVSRALLLAGLVAIAAAGASGPARTAEPGDASLESLVQTWRAADDSAWKAFNVGSAADMISTGAARRAAASRVIAAVDGWAAASTPPGPLQPAIDAALLALRSEEPGVARKALRRLTDLVPPPHADFGLVQFVAGAQAEADGQPAAAEAAYARASGSLDFPSRDQALYRLAVLRDARNDTAEARQAMAQLSTLEPRSSLADRALLWLAEAALRQGDAETAVDRAIDLAGRNTKGEDGARVVLLLARGQRRLGRSAAARQTYLRLVQGYVTQPVALAGWDEMVDWLRSNRRALTGEEKLAGGVLLTRNGREEVGLRLLKEARSDSLPPRLRAESAEREALWYFGRKKYEPARLAYEAMEKTAVGLPARRADSRIGQARCYRNSGRIPEMEKLYSTLASDTTNRVVAARALWELAREYKSRARFSDAEKVLDRYIKAFPFGDDILAALQLRGVLRFMDGRNGLAEEDFQVVTRRAEVRADREAGCYWRARCRLARGDTAGAVAAARTGMANDLPDGIYGYRLRTLLDRLAPGDSATFWRPHPRFDVAGDVYHPSAMADLPAKAWAHFNRGVTLLRGGLMAEGQAEMGLAIDTSPPELNFAEAVAAASVRLGLYSFAMTAARRAMTHTDDPEVEARLWRWIYALGQFDLIGPSAAAVNLDPMLVAGVIRQESLFDERAVSRAGARGLMQLMLPTARLIARARGESPPDPEDLFRPEVSVAYGTYYLKTKLAEFNDRAEVALAAYNAGEAKAHEWEDLLPRYDPDVFRELIDFSETKDYVRRVRYNQETYHLFYDARPAGS